LLLPHVSKNGVYHGYRQPEFLSQDGQGRVTFQQQPAEHEVKNEGLRDPEVVYVLRG
jgi:hypothetical protein